MSDNNNDEKGVVEDPSQSAVVPPATPLPDDSTGKEPANDVSPQKPDPSDPSPSEPDDNRHRFEASVNSSYKKSRIRNVINIQGGNNTFNESSNSEAIDYPSPCAEIGDMPSEHFLPPIEIEKAAQALVNNRIIVLRYDINDSSNVKDSAYDALRFYLKDKGYYYRDGRIPVIHYMKNDKNLVYSSETVTRLSFGNQLDMVQQLADETWALHLQKTLKEARNHLIVVTCLDFEQITQKEGYKKSNIYEFYPKLYQSIQPKVLDDYALNEDDAYNCVNFVAAFFPDLPREWFFLIVKRLLTHLDTHNPQAVNRLYRKHSSGAEQTRPSNGFATKSNKDDVNAQPTPSRESRWIAQSDNVIQGCGVRLLSTTNGKAYRFADGDKAEQIKRAMMLNYPNFVADKFDILTDCYFHAWPPQEYQTGYDSFLRLLIAENLKSINSEWLMRIYKQYALIPYIGKDIGKEFYIFSEILRSAIFLPGIEAQIHAFFEAIAYSPANLEDDYAKILQELCYLMQRSMGLGSKMTMSILFSILSKEDNIAPVLQYLYDVMKDDTLREEYFYFAKSLANYADDSDKSTKVDLLYGIITEIFQEYVFNPISLDTHDFFRSLFTYQPIERTSENLDPIAQMLTSKTVRNHFPDANLYSIWLSDMLKGIFEVALIIYKNDESITEKVAGYYIPGVKQQLKRQQRITILDYTKQCTDSLKQTYLNHKQNRSKNLELWKRRWLAHQLFLRSWRNTDV